MKRLLQALLTFVAVLCVVIGGIYAWLRGSLPEIDGTVDVAGANAPIRITRDRDAVPHIYAESVEDVMFGLGFVHAQDRLWQMEMNRRIGSGRLSEVLGSATVGTDRFLRTLGVRRAAKRTYDELDQETRAILDSYAAGVNAFLATHDGPLPPEFLILDHQPEPWLPQDSLVWGKMMAWDLALNWRNELLRLRLSKLGGLTPEQISELFPPYPGDAPVALPDLRRVWSETPSDLTGNPLPRMPMMSNGSNNWALAGKRTTTGKPFLANDPHLGLAVPSVWYLAHLDCPEFRVIGATLPGIPGVILGRNDRIAWGLTNLNADVQDLYVEKLVTGDPTSYITPEGPRPLTVRREVLRVRDADDLTFNVRETVHGPVISDASSRTANAAEQNHVISLAWTALREGDSTPRALLLMNQAGNWGEFVDAIRFFKEPQQNVVYADVYDNIGYHAIGRIPIRQPENSLQGAMPAPGWDRAYEWAGYIPFEELPHAYNPEDGSIATANHKIVEDSYPHMISKEWAAPYRIRRIESMLAETKSHSMSDMRRMQRDVRSLVAVDFLPLFLAHAIGSETNGPLAEMMSRWDGTMDRHRPEPLLFWAWYREVTRLVFEDELGNMFREFWSARPVLLDDVLRRRQHFCDDERTPRDESCGDIIARAFDLAADHLKEEHGEDPFSWRWGDTHAAHSDHTPFSHQPVLATMFDIVLDAGGDSFTINAATHRIASERTPFKQFHGASFRAIYDLSDPDRSLYMHSTGQSGNVVSPFYRDFAKRWRDVAYIPMSMNREDILRDALGTLVLQPLR